MSDEAKENVSFRIGKQHKRALAKLAAERDQVMGELIREAVEIYLTQQERALWEAEARRSSLVLAEEAQDPGSAEPGAPAHAEGEPRGICSRVALGGGMRRGELITAVLPGEYGKPRPVLMIPHSGQSASSSSSGCEEP